jgi:hypothetical protein
LEGAGKAGRWPRPWPACKTKSRRQSPQVWPNTRPSLRDGFNGVLRALPGDRACLPPSRARSSLANLTPASGCQDHTTSPSALIPVVRARIGRWNHRVHRIPASRFVTIAHTPLQAEAGCPRRCPTEQARLPAADWHDGQFAHGPYAGFARRATNRGRHGVFQRPVPKIVVMLRSMLRSGNISQN